MERNKGYIRDSLQRWLEVDEIPIQLPKDRYLSLQIVAASTFQVEGLMKARALIQVYATVLNVINNKDKEYAKSWLQGQINRMALDPLKSTSAVENLRFTMDLQMYAQALEVLQSY
jgi:hypothetical protein